MTEDTLMAARPRLRAGVRLGPAVRSGPNLVHSVKEPATGRYFQVGPREYFIMSRLDGATTLAEIDREYAERFRRRLTDGHWTQILGTLGGRGLLTGAEPPSAATASEEPPARRSLLYRRMPLVDPQRLFARLEPRLRPLFSAYTVVPLLAVVVALEVVVFGQAADLWGGVARLWDQRPLALAGVFALVWGTVVVHEIAHGLTATRFGAYATEIGVVWRFPVLAPYCRVTDILFLPRRHRVYVSFAGMFGGLVALLPVAIAWPLLEGTAADVAGATLLFGSLSALSNLLPFLGLDGYAMLNHALGLRDLRSESVAYVRGRLRRDPALAPHPRRLVTIYVTYVVCGALAGLVWVCWVVVWAFQALAN